MKFCSLQLIFLLGTISAVSNAQLSDNSEDHDMFAIPEQYVVMFEDSADTHDTWNELQKNFVNEPTLLYAYHDHFKGVALSGVKEQDLKVLQDHSAVTSIEQDGRLVLDSIKNTQSDPPNWGLDRIDDESKFTDPFNGEYRFDDFGEDVTVFVMDTGIRASHTEFSNGKKKGTRVICGYDAFDMRHMQADTSDIIEAPLACNDGVGHGTYVAGIISGSNYGVAKKAYLLSVKVFDYAGHGSVASALAGLQYVQRFQNLQHSQDAATPKTAILNMSFSSPIKLRAMEIAIIKLQLSNVFMVTSAGNKGTYACNNAPGGYGGPMTVAASTHEDLLAPYSNHGFCVDIIAPGDRISSIWNRHDEDTTTLSGTSAAAAHVAGVAVLVLSKFPDYNVDQVTLLLTAMATDEAVGLTDNKPRMTGRLLNMAGLHEIPENFAPLLMEDDKMIPGNTRQ